MNFSNLNHRIKLENACSYLIKSDLPVQTSSNLVGYNDISYFNKIFRKNMILININNAILGRLYISIFIALNSLNSLCIGLVSISMMVLLTSSGDKIEKNSGRRLDNSIFALNAFSIKTGTALGGGLAGILLSVIALIVTILFAKSNQKN